MSDDDTAGGRSARLGLPLLQAGQAQKELVHNEALSLIDLAVQPSVVAVGVDVPPAAPVIGACWVVGAAPSGAWAGQAQAIAGWTAGGWRFVGARRGMTLWREDLATMMRHDGTGWQVADLAGGQVVIGGDVVVRGRGAAIPASAGGTVIDTEARTTITAILGAMRAHGLIGA